MAVSKRLRFEVLRRDNHTCRYCGASSPDVKMTVDHVVPTTLGGSDDPDNLVAACVDCNAGKSSVPAGAPLIADVAQDALRWAEAVKFAAMLQKISREDLQRRVEKFESWWTAWTWTDWKGDSHTFRLPEDWQYSIESLYDAGAGNDDIYHAVTVAMRANKVQADNRFRYFCGVMWRLLRERQEMARDLVETDEEVTD